MKPYTVRRIPGAFALTGAWDGEHWKRANTLEIGEFRPESSDHRPRTRARLLYDTEGIFGIFHVEDRFVRSVHTRYCDPVCLDSCVEFFVKPRPDSGYFNFEFNCSGTLLCSYILNTTRTDTGLRETRDIDPQDAESVKIWHSMPGRVEPEISDPVEWVVEFFVPFSLLETYAGTLGDPSGQTWRANFYKCGDHTSHPHWAGWCPVPEVNFHLPDCFGKLRFG